MIKRLIATLVLLVALAPPVHAAGYFIRSDGSDANTGLADNAGGAWLTIGKANSTNPGLRPGDVVTVRAGTYAHAPSPSANGTAVAPIYFVGDSANPASVVISAASGLTHKRSWVFVAGMKFTGTSAGLTHDPDNSQTLASYCNTRWCQFYPPDSTTGGLGFAPIHTSLQQGFTEGNVVDWCVFRVRNVWTDCNGDDCHNGGRARRNCIRWNTILTTLPIGANANWFMRGADDWTVQGNRIRLTHLSSGITGGAANEGAFFKSYHSRDVDFIGNDWSVEEKNATRSNGYWYYRDSTERIITTADTVRNVGPGTFTFHFNVSGTYDLTTGLGCEWRNWVFRNPHGYGPSFQLRMSDNVLSYCEITSNGAGRGDVSGPINGIKLRGENNLIDHCVFTDSIPGFAAFKFYPAPTSDGAAGKLVVSNSAFFQKAATGLNTSAAYFALRPGIRLELKRNFYHDVADTTSPDGNMPGIRSVTFEVGDANGNVSNSTLYYSRPDSIPFRTAYIANSSGNLVDAASKWAGRTGAAGLAVTDSMAIRFNQALHAASGARGVAEFSLHAGPWQGPADVALPSAIQNLNVRSMTHVSVLLMFSAPGDDSLNGQCKSYDIRYSESPITNDSEFNAATVWAYPVRPKTVGGIERVLVSRLTASTRYYFCIKGVDEAGNKGLRSNMETDLTPTQNFGGGGKGIIPAD